MKILRNINLMELSGLLVGALLAIVLCIMAVVLYAKLNQEGLIGVDEYQLYSNFESGQGLNKGTKVQINGVQVGKVTHLELNDQGQVRLEFTLRSEFKNWITDQAAAYATRDQNVISERVINIAISQQGQVLPPGATIRAGTAQDIETVLRTANELIDRMNLLVKAADTLLKLTMDTNTTIGVLLGSRRLYDKLDHQMDKVDRLTTEFGTITQQANTLLGTTNQNLPRLFSRTDTIATEVLQLSADMSTLSERAMGLLGSLDSSASKVGVIVNDLQGVSGQMGDLVLDGGQTLQRADDLMNGISKFWFIRNKIPTKDTIPLLTDTPW